MGKRKTEIGKAATKSVREAIGIDDGGRLEHEAVVELDRDYVLAELRAASVRAQLYKNEIDVIGLALKANMMRPVEAIEALANVQCLAFLHPEPLEGEIEALVAARIAMRDPSEHKASAERTEPA